MTKTTAEPQPTFPCPRCDVHPVKHENQICANCQEAENAEARAAEEDAKTAREARASGVRGAGWPMDPRDQANGAPQKPPPASARPANAGPRMSLGNVRTGAEELPYRVMVYGVEGVGKSTFGAEAPSPIFIAAEKSTNITTAKFPQPQSWEEVLDAVKELGTQDHEYKTLVIDTVDKIEPLVWDMIIKKENEQIGGKKKRVSSIEDVGGGFMKGYVAALSPWRYLLAMLERLQEKKHMHVILLAHAQVRTFRNPEGEDYDRWEMKLHAKLSALLREWVEANLFANWRTTVKTDRRGRSLRKGESDGNRLLFTQRHAAYDAKNRYGLPNELPLGWREFDREVIANRDPDALMGFIREKIALIAEPEIEAWVNAELERKPSVGRLVRVNNKLAARLEEMADAEPDDAVD